MNNGKYLNMSKEDQAFAEEFKTYRTLDSAGSIRMLRWLQTNFDPSANSCHTCGDAVRHLFNRCVSLWDMFKEEIITHQKPKRNGKKTN